MLDLVSRLIEWFLCLSVSGKFIAIGVVAPMAFVLYIIGKFFYVWVTVKLALLGL